MESLEAKTAEKAKTLERWPTPEAVLGFISPDNWPVFARNREAYARLSSASLGDLPAIYGQPRSRANPASDLDTMMVARNINGLVKACGASTQFREDDVNITAGTFAGRYGKTCTLFALGVYFATYMSDWKGQYSSAFDPRDILQQFPRFLGWWQGIENKADAEAAEKAGQNAVSRWQGQQARGIYYRALLHRFSEAEIIEFERYRTDHASIAEAVAACTEADMDECWHESPAFRRAVDGVTDAIRERQMRNTRV